jgi:hypothetical protein
MNEKKMQGQKKITIIDEKIQGQKIALFVFRCMDSDKTRYVEYWTS